MPTRVVTVEIKKIMCARVRQEATLLEDRIYAADADPEVDTDYIVRARRCNFGVDCNIQGFGCRWSGLNPDYDPFVD